MKILIAVLIFGFIIFFHELGHFLTAKACGIRVNEFFIGFGPAIFSIHGKETTYSLRILPLGGACVMEGEDEESADERAFSNKPVWQRLLVVFAGPFFNFVLAFFLSVILIANIGVDKPVITGVIDGYGAEAAGLASGDTLLSLDHYRVHFYGEVSLYAYMHPNKPIQVTYERDGEVYQTTITPTYDEESGRYLLGLYRNGGYDKTTALETVAYGFHEIRYQIYMTLMSLRMLFTGQVGVTDLSGPVGIVSVIGETYEAAQADGAFYVFLNMVNIAILLTANIGVMNLLPIPALDGGRILLLLVEAVRRKKLPAELEGKVHFVGFAALMVLMVIVLVSDIYKLFV